MCTLEINPSRVFAEQLQQQKSDESNAIGRGCYREKEAALIAQLASNAEDPSSIPGSGRSPGEGIGYPHQYSWASLVAQLVKNLRAMWETQFRYPVQEDPLEKEMATQSSTLAWKIPWMEEPGRLQSMGSQGVGHD